MPLRYSGDRSIRVAIRHPLPSQVSLPDPQREAVVLCSLEERSSAEVAQLTGVPVGTVKSRLRLGMARLRELAGEAS